MANEGALVIDCGELFQILVASVMQVFCMIGLMPGTISFPCVHALVFMFSSFVCVFQEHSLMLHVRFIMKNKSVKQDISSFLLSFSGKSSIFNAFQISTNFIWAFSWLIESIFVEFNRSTVGTWSLSFLPFNDLIILFCMIWISFRSEMVGSWSFSLTMP